MLGAIGVIEFPLIHVILLIIGGTGQLSQLGEGVGMVNLGFNKSVREAEVMGSAQGMLFDSPSSAPTSSQPPQT